MGRAGAVILFLCACQTRPQLLVTVRSDLPLPAALDDTLSAATAVDRLRVEILDDSGAVKDGREWVISDARSLPLSFGVAVTSAPVRVRVRGFRADQQLDEQPLAGVTIDRLLIAGAGEVRNLSLSLRGDCIGLPSDASHTCIDADHLSVDAAESADGGALTLWEPARAAPCAQATPDGTVCVAGGASITGDPSLASVDLISDLIAAPPRMAVLSPFFMDVTEMTVARFRVLGVTVDERCNFTVTPGAHEMEAVRCVPFATARAACQALGGDLPTAAQWEHAARGRGRQSRYPWGSQAPDCSTAALAQPFLCAPDAGVTPPLAGAFPDDRSRDGILDLGGGVREWVLDGPVDFGSCLPAGVLQDPICDGGGSTKGGSFLTPLGDSASALRRRAGDLDDVGFRCVR